MTAEAARASDREDDNSLPNAVLDMIEAAIRTAVEHGMDAPLRARIKRLLPDPLPAADLFGRTAVKTAPCAPMPSSLEYLAAVPDLELQAASTQMARFAKLKSFNGAQHETVRAVKAAFDEILAARRGANARIA